MMYNAFVKQWSNSMRGHHTDREKGAKKEWKTLGANEKKKKKKKQNKRWSKLKSNHIFILYLSFKNTALRIKQALSRLVF